MNDPIHPEALKRKYLHERDKRLRSDGAGQYIDVVDDYGDFAADPWAPDDVERPLCRRQVDVAVLGGGHSGLLSAAGLLGEGITDFLIIDEAADFGGTWYWNRYPGIRCDIEAYIYMPLLEEIGTVPSERYAHGSEIFAHCQAIGRHFGFYDKALLGTRIERLTWNEVQSTWMITTNRGDCISARYVISGNGFLHRPKLPGIPGIKDFAGTIFHSSRWNFDYTGGNSLGGLAKLRDKRVALVGTGATAIQILPHLARDAMQVYLFQRTPAAVDARNNKPTDAAWFGQLAAGWQKERIQTWQQAVMGWGEDHIKDCWTAMARRLRGDDTGTDLDAADRAQAADFAEMDRIRRRTADIVRNPATAQALKPWYNRWCKRPLFADDYLESFNNPNVALVDMEGRGIERITVDGIEVDGTIYPADCIIFASGFRIGAYGANANSYSIEGRDGHLLEELWRGGIQSSLHGTQFHGFPNFHIVGNAAQAGATYNVTMLAQAQATHAAKIVARCLRDGIRTMDVSASAERDWLAVLNEKAIDMTAFERDCTPGSYNNEGKSGRESLFAQTYGGGALEYFEILDNWRMADWSRDADIDYCDDSDIIGR